MLSEGRCGYFMKNKNRYCRQLPVKGSNRCFNHICESVDKVACPLDPTHFVSRSNLEKHLMKCNERRKVNAVYYVSGINSANSDTTIPAPKMSLADVSAVILLRLIARLEELNTALNLIDQVQDLSTGDIHPLILFTLNNHRHWCSNGFPGLNELPSLLQSSTVSLNGNDNEVNKDINSCEDNFAVNSERVVHGSMRHIYQNGCLIRVLKESNLLSTGSLYLEFGAGRAGLSHWINNCLASSELGSRCYDRFPGVWPVKAPETNFIVVELNSVRDKMDKRQRDEGNFTRIRIDIANLDLTRLPLLQENTKPVIAVAKHLCGDATDLSLRCLKNGEKVMNLSGIMFAVCCHNKCTWNETVGRFWLENEAKITSNEFTLITQLSSWAVCGFKHKSFDNINDSSLNYLEALKSGNEDVCQKALHNLNVDFKVRIGQICKRLIDWGRLMYIKNELKFTNTHLITYTSTKVTLENIVIYASE
ncbi:tRNA:m(4)X modification enzyme TRM13 [Schistosoma japonicum]|uniref:tRNA:m(4)X modification enzyme TRM13 n=1 Tax=Schistosoma japonicum TaxID=6182 RepID=C1L5F1_SCHJA|nr:tRNA:m(4)X modification enzyme TRM13 [Schistosoma japonicum]CAX69929.1 Coiled-coil domain-containing protein 76 [Schistosoma japonicum]